MYVQYHLIFSVLVANGSDNRPKLTRNSCEPLAAHSSAFYLLHAGFLLGLFFYREDEGDMFHRNID
jgi:hypothetical protein